jgi:predicted dehydrogenase
MNDHRPVLMGIAGLGGYAAAVCRQMLQAMNLPGAPVRLVAVAEPDLTTHAAAAAQLGAMGVTVFPALGDMLKTDIEAVWLPVPIHLHRLMAEQSLSAGKSVLCEKPPAGAIDDLDAMIAARDRAALPCAVGYQDIYRPQTMLLKRRLLSGAIGTPKAAAVMACWPRDLGYLRRNSWAGRVKCNGVWVMDSPANNALSHYINLALFLLGPRPYEPAIPQAVEAELYRAQPIENYDTVSMRLALEGGLPLLVLLTHSCARRIDPIVHIIAERGSIRAYHADRAEINTPNGDEVIPSDHNHPHLIERFANLVRGQPDDRAVATLESTRPHLIAIGGASEAVPVRDVPAAFIERSATQQATQTLAIKGIEQAFADCVREGRMLHESSRVPWSGPPGRLDLRGYRHFAGPAV